VISIGGLAMGGTGKTPLVLWLARELRERGVAVGMLTRGYRRGDSAEIVIVPAGHEKPVEITGDEAALLARSGVGPVGIAAGRYRAGLELLNHFRVDAFLLDDGFQHWRLARDLDIVCIDALDPWASGGEFPYGRLREGYAALQRAGAIVLTRVQAGRAYRLLIEEIRRHNPVAPIFRSRVAPVEWRLEGGEARMPAAGGLPPAFAFCGLGNPGSFWTTLRALGIAPLGRVAFPDHHRYSSGDLEALSKAARRVGARALLTTAKDGINLPPGARDLPIWQLHVEVEVENGGDLAAQATRVFRTD
jgi:tetraacyldisaccharide 4'-kinase